MTDDSHGIDEGYVKYVSHWQQGPPPDADDVAVLNRWRAPLYKAGLIGHYDDLNVGYGNISVRSRTSAGFVISGTQTGHIENTGPGHYSLVTTVDIDANTVHCIGPVQASSEALTHAALYALSPAVGAVVHVHNRLLWNEHKGSLPTTDASIPYGTPAMAHAFESLWTETAFRESGIAVMAGHDEGLVSIGASLEEAATRMLALAGRDQES